MEFHALRGNIEHNYPQDKPVAFSSWEHPVLATNGAWEGDREPFYEPSNVALSDDEMQGASVDDESGVITKDGVGIGIISDGKPLRGFATPSRKFEIRSLFVQKIGKNEDCSELISQSGVTKTKNRPENHKGNDLDVDPMPSWFQPQEHAELADNELIMTRRLGATSESPARRVAIFLRETLTWPSQLLNVAKNRAQSEFY